jgi:hypothetical protein
VSLFSLFHFSLGEDWECRSLGFHGLSGQGEKAEKQRKKNHPERENANGFFVSRSMVVM